MSQKFKPLRDRIVVRREEESKKKGHTTPLAVKEGDRVLFGKYAGSEIKIDGEELLILKEEEIFGILSGSTSKGVEKHEKVGAGRR